MQFEVLAEGLAFPEGPVVMPDGSVIVMEMFGGQITRIWGDGRREVVARTDGGPNGAQLGPDGALYVCNNGENKTSPYSGGRIERVDLSTGRVERLYDQVDGRGLQMPNDLVFDSDGGIWFTDFGLREGRWTGKSGLYWCRPDGSEIREVWFGGMGYNGVGLSPGGDAVYVSTTFAGRLYRFQLAGPGELAPNLGQRGTPELFVGTSLADGGFDSLAVTASGAVCCATLWTGGITTFTSAGERRFLPLPDEAVTNIAFGGDDMRDAYVTLGRTGRLVRLRWDEPGLRLNF
jgi:gluconolactonase